jgi:hypothetical protein
MRGDPVLWETMKESLTNIPLPKSSALLKSILDETFEQITGRPITTKESFYVPKFDKGGMSKGFISPRFWTEQAVPYLLIRYEKHRKL